MGGEGIGISGAEAAGMLCWWLEAGVDVAVQEEPRNWLRQEAPAESIPAQEAPAAATEEEVPETLDHFRDWLAASNAVPLARSGGRRVLPVGAEDAPVMILADVPSGEEAAAGQPIAGDARDLAERMLAAIGIRADEAYLANISCLHAPGQRLSDRDLQECAAVARRHVALARPKRLLLFGDAPARALTGKPLAEARGHVHTIEGVRTVATFHPRHLLKRTSDKALAWKDLLLLMEEDK